MADVSPGTGGAAGFLVRDGFDRYTQPYGSKPVTAEEWYGTAGLYWRTSNYEKIDGVCFGGYIRDAIGFISTFWWVLVSIQGSIGLSLLDLATSITPFDWFLNSLGEVLKELNDRLYLPFLMPIVMLGALWMGWQGLVLRRSSQATQGAVWMIAATCAGFIFLGNPTGIAKNVNSVVTVTQSTIISTVAGVGVPEGEGPCALDEGAEDRNARVLRCSLWYTFLFVPWAEGQFGAATGNLAVKGFYSREDGQKWVAYTAGGEPKIGTGPSAKSLYNLSGSEEEGIPIEWLQLDTLTFNHDEVINRDFSSLRKAKENQWYGITQRLAKSTNGTGVPPPPNTPESGGNLLDYEVPEDAILPPGAEEWSGANVTHRFQVALFALIAMIAGAGPVMFLSLIMLIQEIGFIFLLLFAPIFLLLGVHPGAGRRIVLNWVEQILNLSLKRIGNAAVLAVLLAFVGSVISSGASWFLQVFMVIAISAAALIFRKRIVDSMSQINLGGAGGDYTQQATGSLRRATNQTVNQATNTATSLATGAGGGGGGLLGTIVGGAIAGAGASGLMNAGRKQGDNQRVDDAGAPIDNEYQEWFDDSVVGQAEREEYDQTSEQRLRDRERFAMNKFDGSATDIAEWKEWANKYGTIDKATGQFIPRAIPRPDDERLAQILRDSGLTLFEDIQEEYDALLAAAEEHSIVDASGQKYLAPVERPDALEVQNRLRDEGVIFSDEVQRYAGEVKVWSEQNASVNAEGIRVPAPVPLPENPHFLRAFQEVGISSYVDRDGRPAPAFIDYQPEAGGQTVLLPNARSSGSGDSEGGIPVPQESADHRADLEGQLDIFTEADEEQKRKAAQERRAAVQAAADAARRRLGD